ncbi:hypothetical protein [Verrucomicrobium spinosum]|uniref:hypothetical protein n=1 Tax=Verrucomicrobium spinosum TaxID=2736 RepID=UPI0009467C3D|nr:hypothetical protein [Verrucomicrobium spinosum]
MIEHNQAVMDGEPVTEREVTAAGKNARAGRAAEGVMDEAERGASDKGRGLRAKPLGVAAGQMDGMDRWTSEREGQRGKGKGIR